MHQVVEDGVGRLEPAILHPGGGDCEVLDWAASRDVGVADVLMPFCGRAEVSLAEIATTPLLEDEDRAWFLTHWLAEFGGEGALARIVCLLARWASRHAARELVAGGADLVEAAAGSGACLAAARLGYRCAARGEFLPPHYQDLRRQLCRLRPLHDGSLPAVGLAQQALVQPVGPVHAWRAFWYMATDIGGEALLRCVTRRLAREIRVVWRSRISRDADPAAHLPAA